MRTCESLFDFLDENEILIEINLKIKDTNDGNTFKIINDHKMLFIAGE